MSVGASHAQNGPLDEPATLRPVTTPSLSARVQSAVIRAHGRVYAASGGRIGHRLLGVPCLLLHTVGAKTGAARTNSLTYARDGASYVVVASTGGGPRNPGWYHNVRRAGGGVAQIGTRRIPVTATSLLPGDADYARLWTLVNEHNHGRYEAYQRRTTRPIPLVVLTPRS